MSGLVPGERLCSVTLYIEKISVSVCLYWSSNTFMFIVLYCIQLCSPVLIFSRWGLAGAGAHLNGGVGGDRRVPGLWFSICYAKLPLGFLHPVGSIVVS